MEIKSLKDLKKLITLCRQTGVEAIEVSDIKMNLGPTPMIVTASKRQKLTANETLPVFNPDGITEEMKIPTDGLTEEQLLFYSAQGHNSTEQQ